MERPQQLANWLISLGNKGEKLASLLLMPRAAAMEQLEVWAQRAKCRYFRGTEGADPGASGIRWNWLACSPPGRHFGIIDTAGRSHVNRTCLLNWKKVVRVTKKLILPSNLESILVIDALAGQNAFLQAQSLFQWLTSMVSFSLNGIARLKGKLFSVLVKNFIFR